MSFSPELDGTERNRSIKKIKIDVADIEIRPDEALYLDEHSWIFPTVVRQVNEMSVKGLLAKKETVTRFILRHRNLKKSKKELTRRRFAKNYYTSRAITARVVKLEAAGLLPNTEAQRQPTRSRRGKRGKKYRS